MNPGSNWLDGLESRLEQRLESFLRSNPQQEALLVEQEARDRQARLREERLRLRQEAELQRQGLLRLAGEIRQWQERVERARAAGATELAGRADAHVKDLMEQGRCRWQTLGELGERFSVVEAKLTSAASGAAPASDRAKTPPATTSLDQDWASFESQNDLEELRRRMRR